MAEPSAWSRAMRSNFEAFKARFPGKDLRGASEGYEHYYSARQLDLLWEMARRCRRRVWLRAS